MTKKSKVVEPEVLEPVVEETMVSEEPKVEDKKKKVEPEFFAGKIVLEKYKNADGEFVVLEGGETVKL